MRMPRLVRYCLALVPLLLAPAVASGQDRLSWSFTYGDFTAGPGGQSNNYGFADPVDGVARRETVTAAAAYLSNFILDGRGTISFNWGPSQSVGNTSTLASAATNVSLPQSPALVVGDVFRQAMGNIPAGAESGFGLVNFNLGTGASWFASGSGSGTPGGTQYDLRSVIQHELTHALGFASAFDETGGSQNGSGTYNRFDKYLYKSATGTDRLLNASDTAFNGAPADLANNSVYWGGEFAVAANGGQRVRMYAPNPFVSERSLSHLDESGATAAMMMSPFINPGETTRNYAGVEIGMLLDLGWNTYEWANTSGNWSEGANVAAGVGVSKWMNSVITNESDPANRKVFAPVGEVTHNMVLTFGGSGGTAYTSVNDLPAGAFKLNRLRLDSSASVTNTISGNPLEMSNDNGFDVTPMIEQRNTGAFVIANNIAIPKGLIVGGAGTGTVTLNGVLSGAGFLTKAGNSTLVLGGANNYTGLTTITAGTIQVNPGGVIPGNVANNGTLQFNPSGAVTYAGAISGSGSLVKTGAGTLTLSGTHTYNGATAINVGTVLLTGQIGASAVTVASGATLAGNGQLGGTLAVQSGATVRPGDGATIATLTLNSSQSATFAGGSNLRVAGGNTPPASGQVRPLGAAHIDRSGRLAGNKLDIGLFAVDALQLGVQYTLTLLHTEGTGSILYPGGVFSADQFNVTASGITFDTSGYQLAGTSDTLTLTFVPVPEPMTVLAVGAAGLGAVGLARRYRRRRSGTLAA
jgi:autotransporter-associated beta strand protein